MSLDVLIGARLHRARMAAAVAYAIQGAGFAVVLTHVPTYKDRLHLGDDAITLVILGVCLAAASGSALSGVVAARRGSRQVVVGGLLLATVSIAAIGLATTLPFFIVAIACYGLALGTVDAAMNMQGIDVERAYGRSVLASFHACNAAGGAAGALSVSAAAWLGWGSGISMTVTASVIGCATLLFTPWLRARVPAGEPPASANGSAVSARGVPAVPGHSTTPAVSSDGGPQGAPGVPVVGPVAVAAGTIALIGAAMVAFPVADSAVSSWSAIFLRDVLLAEPMYAPLGYAAYQAMLIGSRLWGDALVRRAGRVRVVRVGGAVGALGFGVVCVATVWPVAVLGLAATGLGLGVIAPLAFSAAGDRAHEAVERVVQPGPGFAPAVDAATDWAVARLNVFTYAGAVLGGVLTGVFATAHHLRLGFAVLAGLAAVSAVMAGVLAERGVHSQPVGAAGGAVQSPA